MLSDGPAVDITAVDFRYAHGSQWALHGADLHIERGERVCIIGPNGSGKSTLARLIAGLAAPDAGTVSLLGHVVFAGGQPDAKEYRLARRGIGAVFQNPEDQIVTTVVAQDVAFGPENLGIERHAITGRIINALDAVDMLGLWAADPTRMSGGQQQRVAIAGTLAMRPEMIVLDEPTAMLDADSEREVMRLLDTLQRQGTTIVLITHRAEETVHADRVIRMSEGEIVDVQGSATVLPVKQRHSVGYRLAEVNGTSHGRATSHDDAIRVEHVSMVYPDNGQRVLDDFSMWVRPGETVAIMGRNGTGKSTIARLLCALRRPTSGSITVAGIALDHLHRHQRKLLRQRVGFVMQHPERQLFAATVADDIAYGPRNQGMDETDVARCVASAMAMLHVTQLADRRPFTLSGGQQRLVAIAGVIACNPQVLILDEPTANLDQCATERIHGLIDELHRSGVTIVIITHNLEEASKVADRIITMDAHAVQTSWEGLRPSSGARQAQTWAPAAQTPETEARANAARHISAVESTSHAAKPTAGDLERWANHHRSWISSLDPRGALIGFTVLMFSSFAIQTGMQLILAVLMVCGIAAAARVNPARLFSSIRVFLALFLVTGVLNLFVVHTGTPLIALGFLTITDDALTIAVLYSCRLAIVIVLGAILLGATTPTALTDGIAGLLRPLRRLGLHTQEFALVLSLALRFLPTIGSEAQAIFEAQAARGGSVETGSPAKRLRALAAIIIPVFAGALRHADNLSLALDARCYEQGISRTRWRTMRLRTRDILFCILVVGYLAASTWLSLTW